MELRKALLSITAIVIVVLFMGMAMQPATTHSNQRTVTVSVEQQIEYNRYFIQKPVNASDQFSNAFVSWYLNREHANPYKGGHISDFHMNSNETMKTLTSQFLLSDPSAMSLLKEITAQEKAKFATQNNLIHKEFISMLHNGKLKGKDQYVMQAGNSNYLFTRSDSSSTTPPTNVLNTPGQWEMVCISFFSVSMWHPGPWWAPWNGYWYSLNYGEQDVINTIYSGMPAQTYYSSVSQAVDITGILETMLTGALFGLAGGIVGVVAGALAGLLVAVTYYGMSSAYKQIYESTFADNNWGDKYMWLFMVNDYYYPGVTIVGTLDSSLGLFGYLSGGNTQTIFPQIALGSGVPIDINGQPMSLSEYFSTFAQNFANNHGQGINNLVYEGY